MNLDEVIHQSVKAEAKINVYKSIKDSIVKEIEKCQQEIQTASDNSVLYAKTNDLFVAFSEAYKQMVIEKIESLITNGLQTIMENKSIHFRLTTEYKRNNLEINFKLYDEVTDKETDLFCESGGYRNIIAVLLRVVLIILSTPQPSPVILDEAGIGIDVEHHQNFGKFLAELSRKLGIQIIFITHCGEIASQAEHIISVTKDKGVSKVI